MKKKIYYFIIGHLPKKLARVIETIKWGYKLTVESDSYLVETGYIDSLLENDFTGKEGESIPWMNYHFTSFLEDRLSGNQSVFEYGSGFSTLFFANRTQDVTSVECKKEWFERVCTMTQSKKNIKVIYANDDIEYPLIIKNYDKGKKYDIIVVDDIRRVECMKSAIDSLSDRGVLILDDSNRAIYKEGISFYIDKGFNYIKFYGLKPAQFEASETILFYRVGSNCLGI